MEFHLLNKPIIVGIGPGQEAELKIYKLKFENTCGTVRRCIGSCSSCQFDPDTGHRWRDRHEHVRLRKAKTFRLILLLDSF